MPKRKRHQPGKYKPKPEIGPNFTGTKPLTLFQADNGLWGVKDGNSNVEIEPKYQRAEQTEDDKALGIVRRIIMSFRFLPMIGTYSRFSRRTNPYISLRLF